MNYKKIVGSIAGLVLVLAFALMVPVARANMWNQATLFKFNQPVQVPGQVLPVGSYWFMLADNGWQGDQPTNLVMVYNSNRSRLVAVFESRPTQLSGGDWGDVRLDGDTLVTVAEQRGNHGSDQHAALLKWFYPGQADGHEFIYSAREQEELQNAPKQVLTVDNDESMVEPNLIQAATTAGE